MLFHKEGIRIFLSLNGSYCSNNLINSDYEQFKNSSSKLALGKHGCLEFKVSELNLVLQRIQKITGMGIGELEVN